MRERFWQLTNEDAKSIVPNGSTRDYNPIFLFAEKFYSNNLSECNDTTEFERISDNQIKK